MIGSIVGAILLGLLLYCVVMAIRRRRARPDAAMDPEKAAITGVENNLSTPSDVSQTSPAALHDQPINSYLPTSNVQPGFFVDQPDGTLQQPGHPFAIRPQQPNAADMTMPVPESRHV